MRKDWHQGIARVRGHRPVIKNRVIWMRHKDGLVQKHRQSPRICAFNGFNDEARLSFFFRVSRAHHLGIKADDAPAWQIMQTIPCTKMPLKPCQPSFVKGLTRHGVGVAASIMIARQSQNWAWEAAQFFGGKRHIRLMICAIKRKISAGNGKVGRGRHSQCIDQGKVAAE
jgi:hypothetical protein